MPYSYSTGRFLFRKVSDGDGGAYYEIVNMYCGGKIWDYKHWFSSTDEMDEYSRTN